MSNNSASFDGYRIAKRKGYYLDPDGHQFYFGPCLDLEHAEHSEDNHSCDRDGQGNKRLFKYYTARPNKERCHYMALDHPLVQYIIKTRIEERNKEKSKRDEAQKRKKARQQHNLYKPGGIGWFFTKLSFESRQALNRGASKQRFL